MITSHEILPSHDPRDGPLVTASHDALAAAVTYSGVIGYTASAAILRKDGLEIDRTQYNLRRQVSSGKTLSRQAELELLLGDLEQEGNERLRVNSREGSSGKRELSIQTSI